MGKTKELSVEIVLMNAHWQGEMKIKMHEQLKVRLSASCRSLKQLFVYKCSPASLDMQAQWSSSLQRKAFSHSESANNLSANVLLHICYIFLIKYGVSVIMELTV